ncbi:hypothetical protein D3C80_448470 [compost metagenome]
MKKIQSFSNSNLERNRVANVFETQPQKGFEAIHVPTYEVSTNSGGVDVEWQFQSFSELEDAQQYAIQFIMPKGFLCKIVS